MTTETNNAIKCTIALGGLQHVTDPEIGLNVVDLGLIYRIDFLEEDKKIHCRMTLTTEFCPMGESIIDNVQETLSNLFPGYAVYIYLTFDPAWTADMISEEGREFLNN